eukprot:gnl/Spiro4/25041_TR12452_c0_g1_i1.p1 gnl/Spiro4/25041_TR12452_c0_g1~~gnl/Spiro4/25041_TR12452_c0_g1_i1.p1  ORF type:complete len:111 (+),score=24.20 gnl/Spiro4/25041_TR12452_c0_g1_i1:167-499(+)
MANADFAADFTFLPHVLDILKCIDDNKDESEIVTKARELMEKLTNAQRLVDTLADDQTEAQQLRAVEELTAKLRHKTALLHKYRRRLSDFGQVIPETEITAFQQPQHQPQ